MILPTRQIVTILLSVAIFISPAYAESWEPLIQRLAADNFEEKDMRALFSDAGVKFDAGAMSCKLRDLINSRAKGPPALPGVRSGAVYDRFMKASVIAGARFYTRENMESLKEAERHFCVPKEVIVAILLVETDLESFLGKKPAFNTLASMALTNNLEMIRPYLPADLITPENEGFAMMKCTQKSDWAYAELKALIRYAFSRGADPRGIPGSVYGAIGICQFMPSKISSFGVDADKDGCIDVFSKKDAFFSIANYLHSHGWRCKMHMSGRHQVIMTYNHSQVYANTVLQVAERIKRKK
jgi:membrane-bound lytic murein transglycosylase B